jgi:secreted trypsin-like serine protease
MNPHRSFLVSIWVLPHHLTRPLARAAIAIGAVFTAAVVWANPAAAVADGTPAAPGQYPFAVRLTMTHIPRLDGTYYDSACSAALISPTWIITAGHCFHDVNRVPVNGPPQYATTATLTTDGGDQRDPPGHWPDLLGRLSAPPGERRFVTDVQQSTTTDVALARLSRSVTNVSPLGISDTRPPAGAVLTIAGWGATSGFIPTPSSQLSLGQVTIRAVHPSTIAVVGSYPAADTSACLYDSGAPYFSTPPGAPPLLVSTESTGPDCPHADAETTARVDNITEWIKTIVPDLP